MKENEHVTEPIPNHGVLDYRRLGCLLVLLPEKPTTSEPEEESAGGRETTRKGSGGQTGGQRRAAPKGTSRLARLENVSFLKGKGTGASKSLVPSSGNDACHGVARTRSISLSSDIPSSGEATS